MDGSMPIMEQVYLYANETMGVAYNKHRIRTSKMQPSDARYTEASVDKVNLAD